MAGVAKVMSLRSRTRPQDRDLLEEDFFGRPQRTPAGLADQQDDLACNRSLPSHCRPAQARPGSTEICRGRAGLCEGRTDLQRSRRPRRQ